MLFIKEGATIYKYCYRKILHHLHNSICRKHPELRHRKTWLLLHNNAPAYYSEIVLEGAGKTKATIVPDPPYSSDLTPCNVFSFSHFKVKLYGHQFQLTAETASLTREAVQDLPANIFQQCFQQLYHRWQTGMAENNDYFEEGCGYVHLVIWCNKTTLHENTDCSIPLYSTLVIWCIMTRQDLLAFQNLAFLSTKVTVIVRSTLLQTEENFIHQNNFNFITI
jgi:hypothetical protein